MKTFVKLLMLAVSATALSQIPAPQVPVTGNIGSGGNFPLLNTGNLIFAGDANRTMVYPEMSASFIKVTSSVSLTAQRNLVAPLTSGFTFTIKNSTSGGQAIQVIGISGTGVVIPNGSTVNVVCDGTNYINTAISGSGLPVNNPAFTGTLSGPTATIQKDGPIYYADQFAGSDWCAKVDAAMSAATSTTNIVDARNLTGTQTCTNTLNSIPAGMTLLIGNATITLPSANAEVLGQYSSLIGTSRNNSIIIGSVIGNCLIQANNAWTTVTHLTIQNNSSSSGSCDYGANAVDSTVNDVFFNNSYIQLYIADTENSYYNNFDNLYFGNSAASVYTSVQIGNSTYQGNGTRIGSMFRADGSYSCLDNEGSQGISVAYLDCESNAYAAIIMNSVGADSDMAVFGGYVQMPSTPGTNYCAANTTGVGYLNMFGVYNFECNGVTGSSLYVSNYIGLGDKALPGTHTINMYSDLNGHFAVRSSALNPGFEIYTPSAPSQFVEFVSSGVLLAGDTNYNPSLFNFEIYGGLQTAFGQVIPYNATGNTQVNSGLRMVMAPTIPGAGADVMTGPATSTANDCAKFADTVGTLADAGASCYVPLIGSLVTTAATSDNVTITGMTSSGHCSMAPTNLLAANNVATTYISAKTTNQITVTHAVTAAMNFDFVCTSN